MRFTEVELTIRIPVWHALSELFTGRELQEYDCRWMAGVLRNSGLSREAIFDILDREVAPALQANLLYNPTPEMNGWSEDEIKHLVTEYTNKKPTMIERIFPERFLIRHRRKYIQNEVRNLSSALDSAL